MMVRGFLILFAGIAIAMSGCGAKLPREVSVRQPVGTGVDAALKEIVLTNLSDGTPVSVGDYMERENLRFLVLTFGSKGCGICMEKARYFESYLVPNYNILGDGAGSQVRLIGVTTDPASDRPALLTLAQELTHLRWSDPGHDVMMRYFQPEGMRFSVPLTVMLSRNGILWKVTSKEHLTPQALIQKIAATIGSNSVPETPDTPVPPADPFVRPLLAKEVPERLMGASARSCGDRAVVRVGDVLAPKPDGLRAVLLHRGSCAGRPSCQNSAKELAEWSEACQKKWGKTCSWIDIADEDVSCSAESGYAGWSDFADVFSDHFTWSYAPIENSNGTSRLPDMKGPLSLIFDGDGKLVYSREGEIPPEDLAKRMDGDRMASRAVGPDFPLAADMAPGASSAGVNPAGFSALRSLSEFTMVMFWNTWCSSCSEEIKEWHEDPQSAYNLCRVNEGVCRVVAVETKRSESGLDPEAYLSGLIRGNDDFDGWLKLGWTMSLAVEGLPRPDGAAPKGWFDGWVAARYGSSEPMTVLFDREGKIAGKWRSLPGEHGPREAIKLILSKEIH